MDEAGRHDTNQEPTEPFAGDEEGRHPGSEETGQDEPILFEEPVIGPTGDEPQETVDEAAGRPLPEETAATPDALAEPESRREAAAADIPEAPPPPAGTPPGGAPRSDRPLVNDAAWVSTPFEAETRVQESVRPEERSFPSEPAGERAAATGPGVPAANRGSSGRTPPPPARNRDGCSSFVGGALVGAIAGAILATAVVLLILYGLNGTLNFNRSQAVLALEDRTTALQRENERLQSDLETLAATADQLEGRTQELETLPPQVEALRGETDAVREDLNQLDEQVATVATELDEVRSVTATFDTFLTNLRDLLVETKPLPTPTATRTPVPTETAQPTRTPAASPTATVSPEVTPTAATPSPETTPAAEETPVEEATAGPTPAQEPTPSARVAPGSGAPGTLFRLTVTDLEPNTEYAVTISNPAAGFESVDLVESDANGTLQLEYRENFSGLLEPGTYQITVRPGADSTAAPVAETELIIREAGEATPGALLSLDIEPGEVRPGEILTVTIAGAAGELPLDVALRTPAGNLAALETRSAAADGRLIVTYSRSVTSRWNPGEWSVTVSRHPGGPDGVTATFRVSR